MFDSCGNFFENIVFARIALIMVVWRGTEIRKLVIFGRADIGNGMEISLQFVEDKL